MKSFFNLRYLLVFITAIAVGSCSKHSESETNTPSSKNPNIVLIYADDLGYGDLSSYGAESISTPHIDRLAGQGVRFTRAYAGSATCTPSRYALLTGRYAWREEGSGIAPGDSPLIIDSLRVTLADVLHQAGYHTAAIGKWHLGLGPAPEGPDWNGEIKPGPPELGFDYSFLIPATNDRVPTVFLENHHIANLDTDDPIRVSYGQKIGDRPTGKEHPELLRMKASHGHNQTIINGIGRIGYMAGGESAVWNDSTISRVMADKAQHFIQENKDEPFFLYFASHNIHVPRVPGQKFAGKSGMGPRGDAILELDWQVGQIMQAMDSLDITQNTMVIFTSDNGPVLDDGYQDEAVSGARQPRVTAYNKELLPPHEANQPSPNLPSHEPSGPLRGGKYSIFEAGTRVPFIVHWPGHAQKGMVSEALISQIDLLASLGTLTDQQVADSTGSDSFNMLPVLLGKSEDGRNQLVLQTNSPRPLALIQGDWKYIEPSKGPAMNKNTNIELGNSSEPRLFDLKKDIGEQNNLAEKYPEKVRAMADTLEKIRNGGNR